MPQGVLIDDRLPEEHAGIPAEASRGQILLSVFELGLFAEALHLERRSTTGGEARRELHVAIAGLGPTGLNAQHHHLALLGTRVGGADELEEALGLGDDVVRGKDAHDGVGIQLADQVGGEADGGGGVALGRFGEDLALGDAGQLLDDLRTQGGIGEHEDALGRQHFPQAVDGLLDEGPVAGEAEHLL